MNARFIYSILFFILFTAAPFLNQAYAQKKENHAAQPDSLRTVKLKVSGITCQGDILMIETAVEDNVGISECKQVGKVSGTSSFQVVFSPSRISEAEIVKAIENTPSCDHPKEKPYRVKQ